MATKAELEKMDTKYELEHINHNLGRLTRAVDEMFCFDISSIFNGVESSISSCGEDISSSIDKVSESMDNIESALCGIDQSLERSNKLMDKLIAVLKNQQEG